MENKKNHTNTSKELSFKTTPREKIEIPLENELVEIISYKEADNGVVRFSENKIIYTPNENFNGIDFIICKYKKKDEEVTLKISINVGYSFKARSHILSLLGDELIGSDNLAIFELVKNAYDADAEEVKIKFKDLNTPEQSIIIEDDGSGMTLETLSDVWLEIGTDFKRGTKRNPSKKFKRISLGEKGVGRLAVHKLGRSITLETQPEGSKNSYRLSLNWQKLMDDYDYINDTSVAIHKVEESLFDKEKGTRIIVRDLKKTNWEKVDLRDLARKINLIKSPFKQIKGAFDVKIDAGDKQHWIADIKNIDTLLNESIYYFDFVLKKSIDTEFADLSWNYKFTPPATFKLKPRSLSYPDKSKESSEKNNFPSVFSIKSEKFLYDENQKHLKNSDLEGIGEITGRFYVYNLQSIVLKAFGQEKATKTFLKENSGVKVFRDGIRVYNYGEQGDDWLGLDLARVQRLGEHFSKNTTIGSIEITQEGSFQNLKEKTNREGFDENQTYLKFKNICYQIFRVFENTAQSDRELLKDYIDGFKPVKTLSFPDTMNELHQKLREKNIEEEFSPLIKRVEKDYNNMRDVMLNSGMTGINLGIIFHEVDREVRFINAELGTETELENIKKRVKNLIQLLESFSPILKQNKNSITLASKLVDTARRINSSRFGYHNLRFSSPLISGEDQDFQITGPENLLISALSNLIDNGIYWTSNKKELEPDNYTPAIFIGSEIQLFSGPAIVIADNGPGFALEEEDLVFPFRTTKPGGMGLGLYFVNMVMETIGGKLVFPEREDLKIPEYFNGAILALVFPK